VGDSAGGWGELAAHDDELAEVWDRFQRLPDPGENEVLDQFCRNKQLDIPALVRLGARLSDLTVIAYPYAVGIKYRDLVTGQRWTSHGAEFRQLKLVRRGHDSDTVIVAEGETDAARLTMLYPEVDVAVLPAGAKRFTSDFAAQLASYARVLAALDKDAAGDDGWAKLQGLLPTAARFAPPDGNDWCEFEGEPPELPEAPVVDSVGPIVFEDLAALIEAGIPEPEILVDDLLYTEGVHWVSGHPGSGKSIVCMHLSMDVMAQGRHVVWLDYEMGMRSTGRRTVAVGISLDRVRNQFHYAGWPPDAEKHLAAIAERWPGAMIVVDSASKALAAAGKDENSAPEVTAWTVEIVRACKNNALPVIVIDHTKKDAKVEGNSYARGSGAKLADTDVHLWVDKVEDFDRETVGVLCIHRKKDREGCLPPRTWWRIGDGNGGLPLLPSEPPEADANDPNKPAI